MANVIKIKCNCGHELTVDLNNHTPYFEMVETEEREMGVETTYEAEIQVECPECGETIDIKMSYWEYPEGTYNNDEICIEGGNLVEDCSLHDFMIKE